MSKKLYLIYFAEASLKKEEIKYCHFSFLKSNIFHVKLNKGYIYEICEEGGGGKRLVGNQTSYKVD